MGFFLEVLIGGLLAGVLYSLVALGFVLIFKASGVFNFAQGAMVLLAGLALVRSLDCSSMGFAVLAALIGGLLFAAVIMAITAWLVERWCCGRWSTRTASSCSWPPSASPSSSRASAQMLFGSDVYPLLGLPKDACVPVRERCSTAASWSTSSTSGPR